MDIALKELLETINIDGIPVFLQVAPSDLEDADKECRDSIKDKLVKRYKEIGFSDLEWLQEKILSYSIFQTKIRNFKEYVENLDIFIYLCYNIGNLNRRNKMFDIQYAERFGKRSESVEELVSILKGITKRLIPAMDVMYEFIRIRDVYMNEKYGVEIDERTRTAPIRNFKARNEAEGMFFDPNFEKDIYLTEKEIREQKDRRKLVVAKSNEIAVMVIQFDSVIEEIGSRAYDSLFDDKASDSLYKEGLIRLGIDVKLVENMAMQIRGLRNTFSHTYAFYKVFMEMKVGKVIFSRLAIILLNKVGQQLARMYFCAEELNQNGLGVIAANNPSMEVMLNMKLVSLPKDANKKAYLS